MQKIRNLRKIMQMSGCVVTGAVLFCQPVFAQPDSRQETSSAPKGAYADVNTCLNIRKGAGTEYEVSAQLPRNGYCEVLRDEGDWCYVVSEEIKGYVFKDYLVMEMTKEEYLQNTGSQEVIYAYALDEKPEAYAASAIPEAKRREIVEYALQFVGNPYVWGGTSLTNGADCSGFVQSIYRDFGVSLPRVAADQANAGVRISVEEAQPGDLIFYADNGYIYHVVMYIGNGQVVHASSAATGIKVSNVYWEKAVQGARFF